LFVYLRAFSAFVFIRDLGSFLVKNKL